MQFRRALQRVTTATTASTASLLPLPVEVSERLKTLQTDVIMSLLDDSSGIGLGVMFKNNNNTTISNSFTKNLQEMSKYYFAEGGKLIRPTVSLLMSNACNQSSNLYRESPNKNILTEKGSEIYLHQYRIAMVSEMIHTASLVHDDVIDESDLRRGRPTANARWGNRQAVLVGDFILARATKVLCSIGVPDVISTMATIVEDLVKGELMQLTCPSDLTAEEQFQHYLTRSFYKTASLFANSCKSVAMLSGIPDELIIDAFEFGRNLGLAFQLIDDILDYTSSSALLGKPTSNDLKQGLATCPVLFAAREYPQLNEMIHRRFSIDGDVETVHEMVMHSRGLENSHDLARKHSDKAIQLINKFPNGGLVRDCLIETVLTQLERVNEMNKEKLEEEITTSKTTTTTTTKPSSI